MTDGPIFVDSNSEEDSLARLRNGGADYTLMDDIVIQYLITNHGEEALTRLAFGSTPLLTRSLHFAVRRSLPDAESIISQFNAELRGMIADRSYHRLLHLTGFERTSTATGARSTCRMTIKPARSRRSFPTRSSRRAVRPRSPTRRGASTSAVTSTKAGPPCPSSTRPRTSAGPVRVKTRSESSHLGGSRSGNSIDVGQG